MEEKDLEMMVGDAPVCSEISAHPQAIAIMRTAMPDEDAMLDVSELFKVLGDSTRTRILFTLLAAETCVCDLSELLGASVSAVSHQLRILRQARLVRYRRAGKTVYYSLADEHVRSLLSQGLEHVQE